MAKTLTNDELQKQILLALTSDPMPVDLISDQIIGAGVARTKKMLEQMVDSNLIGLVRKGKKIRLYKSIEVVNRISFSHVHLNVFKLPANKTCFLGC